VVNIMKIVSEAKEADINSLIAIMTGDGKTELKVLNSLARRYNGTSIGFFLPALPFHFRPGTALSALKAIKVYLSKYAVTHSLCLIDREFFNDEDQETILRNIISAFGGIGISIKNTEALEESIEIALILRGELAGQRTIVSYLAINGRSDGERRIEDDIAELIRLELGEEVNPNRSAIRNTLRRYGTDVPALIQGASNRNLALAFPSLVCIMRNIEVRTHFPWL